ncbi:putative metal ion transporter [Sesbania bispinosa]|nr:putative metal ion transporter [Sesbania bispinosa]
MKYLKGGRKRRTTRNCRAQRRCRTRHSRGSAGEEDAHREIFGGSAGEEDTFSGGWRGC